MSPLLLIGIVLFGVPFFLIVGFAGYIFWGFVNDDSDARAVLNIALVAMGIGVALIIAHFAGTIIEITPQLALGPAFLYYLGQYALFPVFC